MQFPPSLCECISPWLFYSVVGCLTLHLSLKTWRRLCLSRRRRSIRGCVVLITGASSGIGEACAKVFHAAGAKVIIAARRVTELERVVRDMVEQHPTDNERYHEPRQLHYDATADFPSVQSFASEVCSYYGRLDIVVSNAGISFRGDIDTSTMEVQRRVMEVNYFGQVALVKGLLPFMLSKGSGHIVSVGSIQSKLALGYRSAYSASKHASQSFFDSLRSEVHDSGVRVTVVNPGYVNTNLSLAAIKADGTANNKVSTDTANGMSSHYLATRIMEAVLLNEQEVNIAPFTHLLVIYLRNILPSLVFKILLGKAKKELKNL